MEQVQGMRGISWEEVEFILSKRHARRDAPVVVVHKAMRRERIKPYRRSVPVSRETSSRGLAGSRRAYAKARTPSLGKGERTRTRIRARMSI